MTKAEEKIKNISEAMQVFEEWLKDHEVPSKSKSSASTEKEKEKEKEKDSDGQKDKVPGLGFKDLAAAEGTIKALEGRDPKYQKLAVEGLLKSSKRVLPSTNNPDKIKAIKEAVKYLEKWLEKFEVENRAADNMDYLEIDLIRSLIDNHSVEDKLAKEFLDAYEKQAKGNYKFLRTIYPANSDYKDISWDIVRNKKLLEIKEGLKKDYELFDSEKPTKDHFKFIEWGYSPVPQKLKVKGKRSSDDAEQSRKKRK